MNTKQPNQQMLDELITYLSKHGKTPDGLTTGVTVAHVAVGAELVPDEQERLSDVLQKIIGHEVVVEVTVDPSLIAGFRIEAGDWVIETSIKSQLEKMAQKLKE